MFKARGVARPAHRLFPAHALSRRTRCSVAIRAAAELIEGMLGADLLGFHTFGYLRHFRGTALHGCSG